MEAWMFPTLENAVVIYVLAAEPADFRAARMALARYFISSALARACGGIGLPLNASTSSLSSGIIFDAPQPASIRATMLDIAQSWSGVFMS